jgi:hypothetical protein
VGMLDQVSCKKHIDTRLRQGKISSYHLKMYQNGITIDTVRGTSINIRLIEFLISTMDAGVDKHSVV